MFKIAGVTSVGTDGNLVERTKILSAPETLRFQIYDFANCAERKVTTPSLSCHGISWKLNIYPRGSERLESEPEEWLCVFLCTENGTEAEAKFSFAIGSKLTTMTNEIVRVDDKGWGWDKVVKLTKLLDPQKGYLSPSGTLTIDVDIQVLVDARPVWYPRQPDNDNLMSDLLTKLPHSDICFFVEGRELKAHKCILALRAPMLESLFEDSAVAELDDISYETFQSLLTFIYIGGTPIGSDNVEAATELLRASDRFGCSPLKLLTESIIVEDILDESNAVEWLLFGDAHSCALMKEAAMEVILRCPSILGPEKLQVLEQSPHLLSQLLKGSCCFAPTNEMGRLRVSDLRDQLADQGEDVDGSREMLERRIETILDNIEE